MNLNVMQLANCSTLLRSCLLTQLATEPRMHQGPPLLKEFRSECMFVRWQGSFGQQPADSPSKSGIPFPTHLRAEVAETSRETASKPCQPDVQVCVFWHGAVRTIVPHLSRISSMIRSHVLLDRLSYFWLNFSNMYFGLCFIILQGIFHEK